MPCKLHVTDHEQLKFHEMDLNNDDSIDRAEWHQAGYDDTSFDRVDANHDGEISRSEWYTKQQVQQAFKTSGPRQHQRRLLSETTQDDAAAELHGIFERYAVPRNDAAAELRGIFERYALSESSLPVRLQARGVRINGGHINHPCTSISANGRPNGLCRRSSRRTKTSSSRCC